MIRRPAITLLALILAALGVAACGDDGDETGATDGVTRETIVDPSAVVSNLVGNGSFSVDTEGWTISTPKGISIDSTDQESYEGDESLELEADADEAPDEAAVASQTIATVPNFDEGAHYFLSVQAMSKDLSRNVPVEVRLLYADESSDFFVAGEAGLTNGIPKDTDGKWVELTALVVARKPIDQIDVYAYDTGVEKLTGTAWVDDLRLREVDSAGNG